MSDGLLCLMCRDASRVCVKSAAMMSGVCVPPAAETGVCVAVHYLVLHGILEEILELQNDIYSFVLAPQVTVKIQRISTRFFYIYLFNGLYTHVCTYTNILYTFSNITITDMAF